MVAKKTYQSILRGEVKFELDPATKKVFAAMIKKAKNHKADPDAHRQTIICGAEEFAETKKHSPKTKFK